MPNLDDDTAPAGRTDSAHDATDGGRVSLGGLSDSSAPTGSNPGTWSDQAST